MKTAYWLLLLGCRMVTTTQEASLPIDRKVETAMELMQKQTADADRFLRLFVPSGYVVVQRKNGSETWLPGARFLRKRKAGARYRLLSAKVIHFQDVRKEEGGGYSALATVYFDVRSFRNGLPVTAVRTEVRMPVKNQMTDTWSIYELKVTDL